MKTKKLVVFNMDVEKGYDVIKGLSMQRLSVLVGLPNEETAADILLRKKFFLTITNETTAENLAKSFMDLSNKLMDAQKEVLKT